MIRTVLLIFTFLFSLSLITLAYSQSNVEETLNQSITNSPTSPCTIGSQIAANVSIGQNPNVNVPSDLCGQYSAYVQGACCCKSATGNLGCPNNPVCIDAIK